MHTENVDSFSISNKKFNEYQIEINEIRNNMVYPI